MKNYFVESAHNNYEYPTEEWERLGKPRLWYEEYNKDGIIIHEDRAYGAVRLQIGEEVNTGRDFVVVKNIVVFGPYYNGVLEIYKPYKLL